ncbi:hypothetical protein NDU88_011442 [Pleurodeles waltl]|uniref:Uncharacterized protein n=1 Tax=Pleurodeles waltl TaxID=8319 RepID=A0AAV7R106_PLEWA|nr:hypothetical protein NDU88_011442 [Pleurodeles waltl]
MPLPSNDIEEFQNTDEDGKEDMWVAIVEEGMASSQDPQEKGDARRHVQKSNAGQQDNRQPSSSRKRVSNMRRAHYTRS